MSKDRDSLEAWGSRNVEANLHLPTGFRCFPTEEKLETKKAFDFIFFYCHIFSMCVFLAHLLAYIPIDIDKFFLNSFNFLFHLSIKNTLCKCLKLREISELKYTFFPNFARKH